MARGRTVKHSLNPFEIAGVNPREVSDKDDVLAEVGQFIIEKTRQKAAKSQSPVSGHGRFQSLSSDYKKIKRAAGHGTSPNLKFDGDMLDALKTTIRGNRVTTQVTGKQGAKADGHCNHSGESDLPLRRFIPTDDETYTKDILDGIKQIVRDSST